MSYGLLSLYTRNDKQMPFVISVETRYLEHAALDASRAMQRLSKPETNRS